MNRRAAKKRRYPAAIWILCLILAGAATGLLLRKSAGAQTPETLPVAVFSPDETTAPEAVIPETTLPEATPAQATVPAPSGKQRAQALLAAMTEEEKIAQLFLVRPEALTGTDAVTEADEALLNALSETPVGGLIFFSKNIQEPEQCRKLLQNCQSAAQIPLFLAVDEEGGSVSRIASNPAMGVTPLPPMAEIGEAEAAYQVGISIGLTLRDLGFNLDFAPVADVNTNPDNPIIGSRAFSSDAFTAAELVSACVGGFRDTCVISCLKHFPGHGDTATDSHLGYAESGRTTQELLERELLPFRAGLEAGAPMVMAGHISCPNAAGDRLPASLSPTLIQGLLRDTLGFSGVVVTDAMDMEAITESYPGGEAAVMALEAGCDLILSPENLRESLEAVRNALAEGRLSWDRVEESVLRILQLKLEYELIPPEF